MRKTYLVKLHNDTEVLWSGEGPVPDHMEMIREVDDAYIVEYKRKRKANQHSKKGISRFSEARGTTKGKYKF